MIDSGAGTTALYVGVLFQGDPDKFWSITCPCGFTVHYGVNKLPEVDTPHPCGDPKHWTVKYQARHG